MRRSLSGSAVFAIVQQELRNDIRIPKRRWQRGAEIDSLNTEIAAAEARVKLAEAGSDTEAEAAAWLRLLVLQAPRAVRAQMQMDQHRHSYRNKAARVLELIDFNDAYVATVLAMPKDHISSFNDDLKRLIDWFCKRVGSRSFSNEQFEAISHGLSREIAIYNTVRAAGFGAEMTSRTEDAFGIDMYISDHETGLVVAIDSKTASAFHYRLIDLLREGRLTEADIDLAEKRGFIGVYNGHGTEKRRVVLWRIDHNTLGDIVDFRFEDAAPMLAELSEIFSEYGESTSKEEV